jgi:hypothetical protein
VKKKEISGGEKKYTHERKKGKTNKETKKGHDKVRRESKECGGL